MSTNPINLRVPTFDLTTDEGRLAAHRYNVSGIVDLNQAIRALKTQVDTAQTTATAAQTAAASTAVSGVSSFNTETGDVVYFPYLGLVNDQLGVAAYTVQNTDCGAKVIIGDSSAVTLSLNANITKPWFAFIDNDSSSTATLSPTSGVVHGASQIPAGASGIIFFDGTDWWASTTSGNTPAIPHQWLNAYSPSTGTFTQSQPKATDITNPYVAVTTTYAILATDYQIECTSGTFTVTLPTAVGITGQVYSIKNTGTGSITVATTAAQTIDGQLTQTLSQWSNMVVMSNGTGWIIL